MSLELGNDSQGSSTIESIELYIPQTMEQEIRDAQNAIQHVMSLSGEHVINTLPSIHRVQKVYGPIRYTAIEEFKKAVRVDLLEFEELDIPESVVNTAFDALGIIEGSLLPIGRKKARLITSDLDERITERYEAACELADEFIAKSVWEKWNPDESPEYTATDSIMLKVLGNLKFLERKANAHVSRVQTNAFDDDRKSRDDDRNQDRTDILIRQNQRRTSPSPEEMVIIREMWEEYMSVFEHTSYPLLLEYHFSGYSNSEIARMLHTSEKTIPSKLLQAKREALSLAIERFKWEPEDAALFNFTKEGNAYASPEIERDLDFTGIFKSRDLREVFAMIESLPDLIKKCVLFRIGYIGKGEATEEWLSKENISMHAYRSRLQKAQDLLLEMKHPQTDKKILEIVQSVSKHKILMSTKGRMIAELSNIRDIAMDERIFPNGYFNEEELLLRNALIQEKHNSGTILEVSDLCKMFGWTQPKVSAMLLKISKMDPNELRFSTKEHLIQSDTARWQLISWRLKNMGTDHIFQLSRLNPEQLFLFELLTSIENTYYLSDETIKTRYEEHFNLPHVEKRPFSATAKLSLDALNQDPSYGLVHQYFEAGIREGIFSGKKLIAANIALERLNRHESLVLRAVEESIKEANISRSLWLYLMQDARLACASS